MLIEYSIRITDGEVTVAQRIDCDDEQAEVPAAGGAQAQAQAQKPHQAAKKGPKHKAKDLAASAPLEEPIDDEPQTFLSGGCKVIVFPPVVITCGDDDTGGGEQESTGPSNIYN